MTPDPQSRMILVDKLRAHLEKTSFQEADVVYMLSLIRKLIELDDSRDIYSELKFLCDWAFHTKINRVPIDFITGEHYMPTYKIFEIFSERLDKFLEDNGLKTHMKSNSEKMTLFVSLAKIYSLTPLEIISAEKVIILHYDFDDVEQINYGDGASVSSLGGGVTITEKVTQSR